VLGRSGTGKERAVKLIIGCKSPTPLDASWQEITLLHLDAMNGDQEKMGSYSASALYDSRRSSRTWPSKRHTNMTEPEQGDRVKRAAGRRGYGRRSQKNAQRSFRWHAEAGRAGARASSRAGILLLDEPTAGLDPITSGEIDELILKLQEEHDMASIVVTHDLHSAKTIANRLALLHQGKVADRRHFEELEKSGKRICRGIYEAGFLGSAYVKSGETRAFIIATLAILAAGVSSSGATSIFSLPPID